MTITSDSILEAFSSIEITPPLAFFLLLTVIDSLALAIKKLAPSLFFPVFMVGQIGNGVVSPSIPSGLGTCLGSVKHVWNTLFAYFLLGEKVTTSHFLAVAVIFCGVFVCTVYGYRGGSKNDADSEFTSEKVFAMYFQNPEFLMVTAANVAIGAYAWGRVQSENLLAPIKKGEPQRERSKVLPILFLSNTCAAYSVPSSRAMVGQLIYFIGRMKDQVGSNGTTFLDSLYQEKNELLAVLFCLMLFLPPAAGSIYFLDRALLLYPTLFVTTATACLAAGWQLMTGVTLFGEWREWSAENLVGTLFGLLLQVQGVYLNYTASVRAEEKGKSSAKKRQ